MDIEQLIRARRGPMTTVELTERVNEALIDLGAKPLSYEAVRRWQAGIDKGPSTAAAVTALSRALDVDEEEVLEILGRSRSHDLHRRVAELERQVEDLNRRVDQITDVDRVTARWESLRGDKGVDDDVDSTGNLGT